MQNKMLSVILSSTLAVVSSVNASATPTSPASSPATSLNQDQQQVTWLGVYLEPVPQAVQVQLKKLLPTNGGAMIQKVQEASPAKTAGIQAFDIITHIDGKALENVEQVYQTVQSHKPDETIKLSILRNATRTDVEVKLGTRQVAPQRQFRSPFGNAPLGNTPFGNNPFGNNPFGNTPFGNNPFGNNNNYFWGIPNHFNVPHSQPNWPSFNVPTPQLPNLPNLPSTQNMQSFSQSESMSMKTLPDGKIHIETTSKDNDGNTKEFIFEGDADEIKKQIQENKDMPDSQKQSLLQSLNMNPGNFFNNNFFNNSFMQSFPSINTQTPQTTQPKTAPQPLPRGTLN